MTEQHISKATLLADTQKGYDDFEHLLSSLTDEQMTTPTMDGGWLVKDTIAHLIAWQKRPIALLQAVRDNRELPDPTPNMSADEINELFYHQYKSLPLDTALANLHAVQQQTMNILQASSEEELNRPIAWLGNRPVVQWVIGNNSEHYEEHIGYIQTWLQQTKNA